MVKLPRRVLERWRELSADSAKVRVELLLTSQLDPVTATHVLSRSVRRVVDAFEAEHADLPPGVDEPFAGEWDVARVPEGAMLVGGYKSDAFEELLFAIVAELGREGVRGTLDLYALPQPPTLPAGIGVIEARIRVLGRRVMNGRERWAANRAALDRVLEAATRWCLEARPDRGVTLQHTAMPALLVRRCDSPYGRLRDVMGDAGWTTLRSIGNDRFRSTTVAPDEGCVTIVEGGPVLHRAGWHPSVAAATELLRVVSADAVYGFARRVSRLADAEVPVRQATDRLQTSPLEAIAHEERFVPDAFPIQLLGPGYAGRIPAGEDWRETELGAGRVLLEHVDPAPWFDEITLEEALAGDSVPRSRVVQRARSDFASILFADLTTEERERAHAWNMAHPYVRLSEEIVAKVRALPTTRYVGHWDVALVLRDDRVVEDVELGFAGSIVTRVAGERDFALDPDDVVDVLDRSTRNP
ncbi:MAG: hypothetical protein ACJ75P_03110 [Gaiellaceae bacterium]